MFQRSVQDHPPHARPVENNNQKEKTPSLPPQTDLADLKLDVSKLRHIASSVKVGQLRRDADSPNDERTIGIHNHDQHPLPNGNLLGTHASVQDANRGRNHLERKQDGGHSLMSAIREQLHLHEHPTSDHPHDPHHHHHHHMTRREVRTAKTLFSVVIFFMICWFPLYTLNCVMAFCAHCDPPQWVFDLLITLSHLNSALNPFLYAYRMKDFREALERLLKCKQPAPVTEVRTVCHRNGKSPDGHVVDDLPGRVAVTVSTSPAHLT